MSSVDQGLSNLVDNYRRAGKTEDPVYVDALRKLELQRSKYLDFDKTLTMLIGHARNRTFATYKEVADVNGIEWTKIHWEIGKHLELLCEYSHRKGWPLLSAIVVNAEGRDTGVMKAESMAGFIAAARRLYRTVVDETDFVRSEQESVFNHFAIEIKE